MVLPASQWEKFSSCEIFQSFVTIFCSRMGEEAMPPLLEVCLYFAKSIGRIKWTVHFIISYCEYRLNRNLCDTREVDVSGLRFVRPICF